MRYPSILVFSLAALVAGAERAIAQAQGVPGLSLRSPAYNPEEGRLPAFSLAKAVEYLDVAAQDWMRAKSCGECHTNFAYIMVRPLLKTPSSALEDTRRYLEARVQRLSEVKKPQIRSEAATLAAALAIDDARTGRLRPVTRKALDRMWDFQSSGPDHSRGSWDSHNDACGSELIAEISTPYSFSLAMMAAHLAPEKYAQTPKAREGLARARAYFGSARKDSVQAQAFMLWASTYLDGVLGDAERQKIVGSILARQGKDDGWSSDFWERNEAPALKDRPSDGYGTGLAVYVLRQAGVPANRPEIVRAVNWLKRNQRLSGRWFTPFHSPGETTQLKVGTREFYNQSMGTAFALLALDSCGELKSPRAVPERSLRRAAGLALGERLLSSRLRRFPPDRSLASTKCDSSRLHGL